MEDQAKIIQKHFENQIMKEKIDAAPFGWSSLKAFRAALYRSTPETHLGLQVIGDATFNKNVVHAALLTEFVNTLGNAWKKHSNINPKLEKSH